MKADSLPSFLKNAGLAAALTVLFVVTCGPFPNGIPIVIYFVIYYAFDIRERINQLFHVLNDVDEYLDNVDVEAVYRSEERMSIEEAGRLAMEERNRKHDAQMTGENFTRES